MVKELEIWKPIPNYELYEVSSIGRIRNSNTQKVLKIYKQNSGYYMATLTPYKKNLLVHRAMTFAFIPNPNNYPHVNHINGIKTDNTLDNLEWCTVQQNRMHSVAMGLAGTTKGRRSHSKLDEVQVLTIRKCLSGGMQCKTLAAHFKVSPTLISAIKRRIAWFNLQ